MHKPSPPGAQRPKKMPKYQVIAHRGTITRAPELTEAAFRWARNSAADYLELDVHRTKDGQFEVVRLRLLHTQRRPPVAPEPEVVPLCAITLILQASFFNVGAGGDDCGDEK